MVGLQHFLILGAILFCIGLFGALGKRNAVAVLISTELMFNAVNITLVAFARYAAPEQLAGQIFAVFAITVAAGAAALGLAIVLAVYRSRKTVSLEDIDLLKW